MPGTRIGHCQRSVVLLSGRQAQGSDEEGEKENRRAQGTMPGTRIGIFYRSSCLIVLIFCRLYFQQWSSFLIVQCLIGKPIFLVILVLMQSYCLIVQCLVVQKPIFLVVQYSCGQIDLSFSVQLSRSPSFFVVWYSCGLVVLLSAVVSGCQEDHL